MEGKLKENDVGRGNKVWERARGNMNGRHDLGGSCRFGTVRLGEPHLNDTRKET